jgi:phosphate transport system substrate-binding protein
MKMRRKSRKSSKAIALGLGLTLAVTSMLTACSESGASGEGRTVVIAGSTSVQPFAEVMAADYEGLFRGSPVDVQGGGSGNGIIAARTGVADIGMSSRPLRRAEVDCTRYASNERSCYERRNVETGTYLEYYERCGGCQRVVTIALDGLALIVHPDNPILDLSLQQIRDIYTREITNWSELGWNAPLSNGDIHVVTREEGSGTRGAFEEMVMQWRTTAVTQVEVPVPPCESCEHCESCGEGRTVTYERRDVTNHSASIHARTIVLNTNGAIRQFVAGNPNAIGYISLGTVEIDGLDPVIGLSIDGVSPCTENVLTGMYGLFRPFVFLIAEDPMPETLTFIEFMRSNDGQAILIEKGLVSGFDASGLAYTGGAG